MIRGGCIMSVEVADEPEGVCDPDRSWFLPFSMHTSPPVTRSRLLPKGVDDKPL